MKTKLTEAELKNDPSLKWCPYRQWEAVWSDTHQQDLRFVRFENGKARLATLHGISELPDLVEPLQIRRTSVMGDTKKDNWVSIRLRMTEGQEWVALNRTTGERIKCANQDEAEKTCQSKI